MCRSTAAAAALARLAKETAGGPAQEIITAADGVSILLSALRAASATPTIKQSVRLALRYLNSYTPAATQMRDLGLLRPRAADGSGGGSADLFADLE